MQESKKNTVAFIDRLELSEEQRKRLEAGAVLYKRHANITFLVVSYKNNHLTVKVKQEKNYTGKYATKNELIEKAKKLFSEFSTDFQPEKITVGAVPYTFPKSDQITPEYLKKELQKRSIRIKDIHEDTGIEVSNLSAWINDTRPMSKIVKNMFYFYLLSKEKCKIHPNTDNNGF